MYKVYHQVYYRPKEIQRFIELFPNRISFTVKNVLHFSITNTNHLIQKKVKSMTPKM